jgi:predicted AAA+ superfamily ATPase
LINRLIQKEIEEIIQDNEKNYISQPDLIKKKPAIIVYGARQVGKTTLVKQILEKYPNNSNYINCELTYNKEPLETQDDKVLKTFLGDKKLIVIDEAQKITNIGLTLKIIIDTFPEYQIIATGSSSFDLSNKIKEPLTGRAFEFMLYPFSLKEIAAKYDFSSPSILENILRYGLYPEVINRLYEVSENSAREKLDEITGNYLYKDIFELENLKRPDIILKLLKALALQIGNEVSINELATLLKVNVNTIDRYLYLLEQSFVIFILHSFSRNLRKELGKKYKIYFYDLGIRNSLIQNYNSLDIRTDTGALWENFCIIERMKYNQVHHKFVNKYFWRTYDQKEIDYIEEHSGQLDGYEFKWGKETRKYNPPRAFMDNYENATVKRIDRENYQEFLLKE